MLGVHGLGAEVAELKDEILDIQVRGLLLQAFVPGFQREFTGAVLDVDQRV